MNLYVKPENTNCIRSYQRSHTKKTVWLLSSQQNFCRPKQNLVGTINFFWMNINRTVFSVHIHNCEFFGIKIGL